MKHFTSAFLQRTREVMLEFGKDEMEMHDVVAVWAAVENPPAKDLEERIGSADGWSVTRRKFAMERYVCTSADVDSAARTLVILTVQ